MTRCELAERSYTFAFTDLYLSRLGETQNEIYFCVGVVNLTATNCVDFPGFIRK